MHSHVNRKAISNTQYLNCLLDRFFDDPGDGFFDGFWRRRRGAAGNQRQDESQGQGQS
jgi:hypothetical protein